MRVTNFHFLSVLAMVCSAATFAAPALAADDTSEANSPPILDPYANIRYRLELVDQDNLPNDAAASTLRIRAGVRTREWHGLSALVEAEAIAHLGPEDFNDTVNGRAQYPVVADPDDILLNQAYVQWRIPERIEARAGRQVINLDNQRWVGSVGWRQNDQTFDAAMATVNPTPSTSLSYGYAWRVNRIFGPDSPQGIWRDTNIHMLRATAAIPAIGSVTAYGYLLDIPAAPTSSSQSWGVRLTGQQAVSEDIGLSYTAEYARQSDYGPHPRDFSLSYLLIEPGVSFGPVSVKAGYERLAGNGVDALQTPLATLHAFNGWADTFLRTPPNGLRDLYIDGTIRPIGSGPFRTTALRLVYHDFRSTRGDIHYGREWDAQLTVPIRRGWSVMAKYADYDSAGFATDTRKFWLATQIEF